jgi:hypothetical protein
MSNLALHPNFRHPGDKFKGDDSVQVSEHYQDQPTTQSIEDKQHFSEAYLRDINAQHAAFQGFDIQPAGNAARSQEEEPTTAKGPQEDEFGAHQATPVDGSTLPRNHE